LITEFGEKMVKSTVQIVKVCMIDEVLGCNTWLRARACPKAYHLLFVIPPSSKGETIKPSEKVASQSTR
jgi:hypothetical protein